MAQAQVHVQGQAHVLVGEPPNIDRALPEVLRSGQEDRAS